MNGSNLFRMLLLAAALGFTTACSDEADVDETLEGADEAVQEAGDAIRESME